MIKSVTKSYEPCFNEVICVDVDFEEYEYVESVLSEKIRLRLETSRYREWWRSVYDMLKSLLQYSFIPRRVFRTYHGIHVYLPLKCIPKVEFRVRSIFGDDNERIWVDENRLLWRMPTNICFKTRELREVKVWELI